MNRQEISAFLANCKVSDMMAYADLGEGGTVVVAEDGKKYRYSNYQLDQAEVKAKAQARASKPKPKPRTSRTTKSKTAQQYLKDKKLAKAKPKPASKPATKAGSAKKPGNGK